MADVLVHCVENHQQKSSNESHGFRFTWLSIILVEPTVFFNLFNGSEFNFHASLIDFIRQLRKAQTVKIWDHLDVNGSSYLISNFLDILYLSEQFYKILIAPYACLYDS